MAMSARDAAIDFSEPPGTVRLEVDAASTRVLSPQPSSSPDDPLNWSRVRKASHIGLLLLYVFAIFGSNTASTPLYDGMSKTLGYGEFVLDISFAANSAALGVGSLVFVPFALLLGRRCIYILTALLMFGCDIWVARAGCSSDVIGSSIVQGIAGSVNEALFQMTVVDLFFVHQRGTINGFYLFTSAAGNFLMPVASGYIAKASNWRWSLWTMAIIMGCIAVLLVFFLEESKFDPSSLEVAEHTFISSNAEPNLRGMMSPTTKVSQAPAATNSNSEREDIIHEKIQKSFFRRLRLFTITGNISRKTFVAQFYRPFVILVSFPGILIGAFLYGFYVTAVNILAVTQSIYYPEAPYHFSSIGVGNLNIAPAIGAAVGALYGGPLADRLILMFAKRKNGVYEPEMRLRLFLLPAIGMSSGLFIYGLSVAQGKPWYIGSVGGGFMGFGLGGGGDLLISYLQDSYAQIIGPAFIGAVFLVNIMAFIFLFVLTPWQEAVGSYDMFVQLGSISVALNLLVIPVLIWGKSWRRHFAGRYLRLAEQTAVNS